MLKMPTVLDRRIDLIYRRILWPLLLRLPPETAHALALTALRLLPALTRRADPPELAVRLWGMDFVNPIGLAAGMDKDAKAVLGWQMLGFGFVELGTVTPRPQAGNPKPRVWRIPHKRALVNRLGFPSEGMTAVERRLRSIRADKRIVRLGISLGPNKDTPCDQIAKDYRALVQTFAKHADFLVVNLSSPNTPGLRAFQTASRAEALLSEILDALKCLPQSCTAERSHDVKQPSRPPLLVKLAPDWVGEELERTCKVLLDLGVSGVVATNTSADPSLLAELGCSIVGGVSGEPLKLRSRETIRRIFRFTGGRLPIIGVGGVASGQDAYAHLRAGASLVQLYTALIYEGPGLVERIKRELTTLIRLDGLKSVSEAVGVDA